MKDPSWSELYHFVSFLNRQLQDFETSAFCSPLLKDDLPRFYNFVLNFMIQMSRVSKKLEYLNLNPYHAELYTQDITCMLNCFEEISQNLAFFLSLLCS